LLNYFFKREALKLGVTQKRISKKALQYLEDYPWEGNIRELENFVKYILSSVDNDIVGVNEIPDHFKKELYQRNSDNSIIFPEDPMVSANKLSPASVESLFAGYSWEDLEKDYVLYLLNKNKWNITRAARDAKINRSTFDSRMKRLGINKR
jgi:DNA-binding NtrC family response regulator